MAASVFCKQIFTRNINHYYFNFLFELPCLKMSLSSVFIFIINFLLKKCMELMISINTSFTNLVRRDLARERKICFVLHHAKVSIKLYILTYLL